MLGDEGAKDRPGTRAVSIATGRRVVRRERRRAPFENQPMHRAHQPECHRRRDGLVGIAGEHVGDRTASGDVVRRTLQECLVERRPKSPAAVRLQSHILRNVDGAHQRLPRKKDTSDRIAITNAIRA